MPDIAAQERMVDNGTGQLQVQTGETDDTDEYHMIYMHNTKILYIFNHLLYMQSPNIFNRTGFSFKLEPPSE